eukprot:5853202-Heterocapsa_arctica.AAC.1
MNVFLNTGAAAQEGQYREHQSLRNDLFLIDVEQLIYVYGKYDIIVEQTNANKFNGSNAYARTATCSA